MARILASLFWGVSAFTFGSDWAYLSGNEARSLYIDLASIRLTGSIESAWFGYEFRLRNQASKASRLIQA